MAIEVVPISVAQYTGTNEVQSNATQSASVTINTTLQNNDLLLLFHTTETGSSNLPAPSSGSIHNSANFEPGISYNSGNFANGTTAGFVDLGYARGEMSNGDFHICAGAYALTLDSANTLSNLEVRMRYTNLGTAGARTSKVTCFVVRGADVSDFSSSSSTGVLVSRSSASGSPDNDGDLEWIAPTNSLFSSSTYSGTITQFVLGTVRRNGAIRQSNGTNQNPEDDTNNTLLTSNASTTWALDTGGFGVVEGGTQARSGGLTSTHNKIVYFNRSRTFANLSYPYAFRMSHGGTGHSDTNSGASLSIILREASTGTVETASVTGSYSVQNSDSVQGDYGVQTSSPVTASYSVQVSTPVSADYSVQTTPSAQVAADYGVQSSTEVQSDYGVRVEESVSASYEVESSTVESTQVSASYALQVSDDVQSDYGVKVSSEVSASYGLQVSSDVSADYSVQRVLSDQVDSDYAVRNSSPVSASYSLTVSRDVLGDYGVQSESTVQSDYAIANFKEIGASYVVDDGITNATVTLLDSIPIQSVGTAQTTLSFSAIGQSQFAGQSLVIALVGVGEFQAVGGGNWNQYHPFFSHSPAMNEVTNTLSTTTAAPEFVHGTSASNESNAFCYLAYRQISASDTFKSYDVTVDIPLTAGGNFVGGVLLRVNNGVIPSSWPKHRNQISINSGTAYTTPAQNYDANSLILSLLAFHDDESGSVVTSEKGIEELYQSNITNRGGLQSPRGLITEEPVGNVALTNRSQVYSLPTGMTPVKLLLFNFEIQAGETQTQQVSAEYVVQGVPVTSPVTGSYGVGGTDTATATYSVQSTDTVAVGSDYAVKPEAAVSADYAVITSDQVAGDYALQVQQPVSGSYGVTSSKEVDGDYAVLNSRIVTSNYLVATANVQFASVTASYGVTAETEVGATYGVGQSAQVDADYAVLNESSVSADYGVQVQSPVSASYALQATESVGATFSVQNTQAVESDYAVQNSEQVTGEYLVQQLNVQGQVSASYDVGVPQVRNIGASYAVSGQTTVNQETVLGEYVVRNDAYVAEKALRQLGYLKQRTK